MTAQPEFRCLITVEADDDPLTPCRVLGLFTQRGTLPERFSACRLGGEVLSIAIETTAPEVLLEPLVRKLRNIPTVRRVSRAWVRLHRADCP